MSFSISTLYIVISCHCDLPLTYLAECNDGTVENIKWLLQVHPMDLNNISFLLTEVIRSFSILPNPSSLHEIGFFLALSQGKIAIAEFLVFLIDLKRIHCDLFFVVLCGTAVLPSVKFLYQSYNINIYFDDSMAFILACEHGNLETAKYLYSLDVEKRFKIDGNFILQVILKKQFLVADWLFTMSRLTIHDLPDPFSYSKVVADFQMVKYLIGLGLDYHAGDEHLFRHACRNEDLQYARYLVDLNHDVDYHARNDEAFREAYANKHYPVAEWLLTLTYKGKISRWKYGWQIYRLKKKLRKR